MSHLRHDHHRLRTLRRVRRARRGYDYLVMHDDIEALEELQRDLEEAAADVAERVKRLRVTQTPGPDEL
jgi:hypothetical protein